MVTSKVLEPRARQKLTATRCTCTVFFLLAGESARRCQVQRLIAEVRGVNIVHISRGRRADGRKLPALSRGIDESEGSRWRRCRKRRNTPASEMSPYCHSSGGRRGFSPLAPRNTRCDKFTSRDVNPQPATPKMSLFAVSHGTIPLAAISNTLILL